MQNKKTYDKPALSLQQQIRLLIDRGLIIPDPKKAENSLKFIGYYRLSGYMIPFYSSKDCFKPNTKFEQIIDLYNFDRKLRILIFDAIEIIEVALRSVITDTMSLKYGSHWFADKKLFESEEKHKLILNTIKNSTANSNTVTRDNFISHYYKNYTDPVLPPSWMTLETLSIGALSTIFKAMKRDIRKSIAFQFKLDELIFSSWLHSLTYTRNLTAHHSRIWNRKFTIKPKIPRRYANFLNDNTCFFTQYIIISYLLKIIDINHWKQKLIDLFSEHHSVKLGQMGFIKNWLDIKL